MPLRLEAITLRALVLLPLVLSPALGLLTPYASLLFVIPLFFVTLARGQMREAYATYEARVCLAVFAAMAIVCVVTADSVSDALRAFNFTMLLAYGPIVLFMQQRAGRIAVDRVMQLSAVGALVGLVELVLAVALAALFRMETSRPTGPAIGPIVLSNGLLALGFIALGGVLVDRSRRSWLYLLAPLAAISATMITGSRGPLLAVPVEVIVAAIFIWRVRFGSSARMGWVGLASVLVAGVVGIAVLARGRAGSIANIIETLVGGGTVTDESTRQRLALYEAGSKSFLQSPWIGHGWGNIMTSVRPLLSAGDASLANLPQLHNDVLNFAVGAGAVGVVCYLAIITAPIVGALRSPRDGFRTVRLFGTTLLTIVYVGGGLTDLMFGFEFHTYLFSMLTAILIGLCREPEVKS
jgi:O-antigen ligase